MHEEKTMIWKRRAPLAVFLTMLTGAPAFAQSANNSGLAGVVRDTSGAVLPGVTVEAASPALIEKTKTAVTGEDGSYRIVDLRPGAYTVMFSLAGFRTVRREGIDLPAAFTATVSVEMEVGAIAETVTVSGAAPLVDVQNVTSSRVMGRDLLDSIPVTSRSPQGYAALMPGVIGQGIAGTPGGREEMNTASHGAQARDSIFLIDGWSTGGARGEGGAADFFRISQTYVQEITVTLGGGTAEQAYSGTVTNVIPKEGGNRVTGSVYFDYAGRNFAASNITPELESQGFTKDSLSNLKKLWDVSPAVGGPLMRDKVWFFTSYRNAGSLQSRAGLFENATPLGWVYTPDRTRPAYIRLTDKSRNLRLTWQATPKNKFSGFVDSQPHTVFQRGYQSQISPEATAYAPFPNFIYSLNWKSTLSSRFLLDTTFTYDSTDIPQKPQDQTTCDCQSPAITPDVIAARDSQSGISFRANADINGQEPYGHSNSRALRYISSVSYVTGNHAARFGFRLMKGHEWFEQYANQSVAYTLRNGTAQTITEYANPTRWQNNIDADLGVFAQDQWTMKRMTLTGGLRYDYYDGGGAPAVLAAGRFVPARSFPGTKHSPRWKDLSPRIGVAYDLFGDSRTALKASIGRFITTTSSSGGFGSPFGSDSPNPVVRSVLSVTRNWTDNNNDHIPDCNLLNPLANSGIDDCGIINNLNFGQSNPNALVISPDILSGNRQYNWDMSLLVQRQIMNGVSITAGYYRKQFYNFTVTENLLFKPSDYTGYCVTAPSDSRLPNGGGNQICGLYDLDPLLQGKGQSAIQLESMFGTRVNNYDGIDLTGQSRLPHGINVSGGLNIGRTHTNTCFVIDSPQALRFCDTRPPFQPNMSFVGVVPLPWYGMSTSFTYRDYPGFQISATQQYTAAQTTLPPGRGFASGQTGTVNVQLIEPGTMFGPRQRQLDFRLSKRFRFATTRRVSANLDVSNLFNTSTATGINTTFGPNWMRATGIQKGRWAKLGVQLDF
jgi:Carboxypeptidase regulatory-like domain